MLEVAAGVEVFDAVGFVVCPAKAADAASPNTSIPVKINFFISSSVFKSSLYESSGTYAKLANPFHTHDEQRLCRIAFPFLLAISWR